MAEPRPRLRTLAEEWADFERRVLDDCGDELRAKIRAGFYAGGMVVLRILQDAANLPDASADEQIEILDRELNEFGSDCVSAHGRGHREVTPAFWRKDS